MKNPEYIRLIAQLTELQHLSSALSVLHWDQEVCMPKNVAQARAATIGYFSGLVHEKFLALNKGKALAKLERWSRDHAKTSEASVVREVWRTYDRERKLSQQFVEDFAQLCSEAQGVWAKARAASDFEMFLPYLEKIVAMRQQEAKLVGYRVSPYDALLDAFEPGMTSSVLTALFDELKTALVPLLAAAKKKKASKIPKGKYALEKQQKLNEFLAAKIGFDFSSGKLDASTHPFTIGIHPHDVRITTRYKESNPLYAIGSTIHETGHALYEQGLPTQHVGTPLAEAVSLGMHESQSRLWENMIGKSPSFWRWFYPEVCKVFPEFTNMKFDDLMTHINHVQPSLIRTEADELTYNLHIIVRFEIEKAMIEGTLKPRDLPGVWNAKMKEYLGVDVPDDARGVLQDVHWSGGMIGYFPTYTLGNLIAAQLYAALQCEIPALNQAYSKGDFTDVREWLQKNIHQHGRRYDAQTLVERITGKPLSSADFIAYCKEKFVR